MRLGQVRLVEVRLRQVRFSHVQFGSVQFVSVRFGQVWLGQVWLGQDRLGQVGLGQVRISQVRLRQDGQVKFGQVRLGQVWLGQARSGWIWSGQTETFIRVARLRSPQVLCFQVCTMQQLRAKRGQSQHSRSQLCIKQEVREARRFGLEKNITFLFSTEEIGCKQIIFCVSCCLQTDTFIRAKGFIPQRAKLSKGYTPSGQVQGPLGSCASRFVPCSSSERSEVRVSIARYGIYPERVG